MVVGLIGYVTLFRSSPGPLSTEHAAVAGSSFIKDCKKCHVEKDVSRGCLSCHSEIQSQLTNQKGFHNFLLKEKKVSCAVCHSEHNGPGFKMINKVSWEGKDFREFKHPHVEFHLIGKHQNLACEKCHQPKNKKETYLGLTQNCKECHTDVHAGGLTQDCQKCHGQERFKPSVNFNHDKFFPLKGGHAGVTCNKCHLIKDSTNKEKSPLFPFNHVKGKRCSDCHSNPHRTNWKSDCTACHQANDAHWTNASSRMTKETHALTGFRLSSPHNKASCTECHKPGLSFDQKYPKPQTKFARSEKSCESCHSDAHQGQFKSTHSRCFDCHFQEKFIPSKFTAKDHKTFPLIGKHATAACNKCHIKDKRTGVRQFVASPHECDQCHRDVHRGQFRMKNRTLCESCHSSPKDWKILSFDHNKQSRFKLDQAHTKVTCSECHPRVHLSNGESIVQYKPLRSQCSDCHDFSQ